MGDEERPINCDKPRFYIMDLENYTDSFLREIIVWMDKKIKSLEKQLKNAKSKKYRTQIN